MPTHHSAADLHVHTTASDGTASPAEVLEWASEATDLAIIAICDHNTNEGALEAAAIAHHYRVEVVIGQEVESRDGHVLGLWTPERVRPGRPAEDTVADIHRQGGLAVIAHPFAPRWWHKHGLCRGEKEVYDRVGFDAVEVANSTPLLFFANFHARRYWKSAQAQLAATGGSDAHILSAIGTSRTSFPGSTAVDLRRALLQKTTRGWGPSIQPLRVLRYALRAPEIRERNAGVRRRAADDAEDLCESCEGCASAGPTR